MIINERPIRQLITWLIKGTKGGKTRAKIIANLKNDPQNANQIATKLKVDYKTVRHHIAILEKNRLIIPVGDHYSTVYFLSELMEENYPIFLEIAQMNNVNNRTFKITRTNIPKSWPKIGNAHERIVGVGSEDLL
jgi:predicted transcriptional regulator